MTNDKRNIIVIDVGDISMKDAEYLLQPRVSMLSLLIDYTEISIKYLVKSVSDLKKL